VPNLFTCCHYARPLPAPPRSRSPEPRTLIPNQQQPPPRAQQPPWARRRGGGARWVSCSTQPAWPRWPPSRRRSRAWLFRTCRCRTSGGWTGPSSAAPASAASSSIRTTPSPRPTRPRSGRRLPLRSTSAGRHSRPAHSPSTATQQVCSSLAAFPQ
jgi:hypothetical protein